jgi:hypothetical protein
MDAINRPAIVVRPAQPFLDWLHRVDPTSAHLRLEDRQREPTIYLVAECDSQEQAIEYLEESVRDIFEEQCLVPRAGCLACEADLMTFQSWFEVSTP